MNTQTYLVICQLYRASGNFTKTFIVLSPFPFPLYTPLMVSFSDLKNSFKFQRQAKQVQNELKHIHVEAEAPGIKVVISAAMEVISIDVDPSVSSDRVGPLLTDALNRALKKAQIVSSQRMQGVMGEMGLGVK